jgi:competence protein ComGA
MEERLQNILKIALAYQVTDIHFDLNRAEKTIVIDMRMNGKIFRLKPDADDYALFHYLMYRANLDITCIFDPQTGAFEETVDGGHLSLRFAIVTSANNTSGVLRILNNHRELSVNDLSMDGAVRNWLSRITSHRDGLYVFSGPTGSGKTTTLYTLLNASQGKKIFTIEDLIEVYSDRYIQLQVNEKQHLSYAEGIKQLMRHDPDIVMIGEIRDSEAALMAVRCALTGHLVVTSLHASSCVSAVHRLMDLGVSGFQLQDVLRGISNQRLYRMKNGKYAGIYEIMDHREVNYWFAERRTSTRFRNLETAIEQAVENGWLDREEAVEDLSD